MSINFTISNLILTKKKYDSEDLKERDGNFLTLTSLKYLGRKKSQN